MSIRIRNRHRFLSAKSLGKLFLICIVVFVFLEYRLVNFYATTVEPVHESLHGDRAALYDGRSISGDFYLSNSTHFRSTVRNAHISEAYAVYYNIKNVSVRRIVEPPDLIKGVVGWRKVTGAVPVLNFSTPFISRPIIYQTKPNIEELERKYYRLQATKVNKFNYTTILIPSSLCDIDTHMLIVVHSFHTHKEKRAEIRSTWGSVVNGNRSWPGIGKIQHKARLVFVLGLHNDPGLNDLMKEEHDKYNDIVVGNFTDSYRNMTLKSLLGLKLFVEHCSNVRYLLKSDDDMFINLPYLCQILETRQPRRAVMGPYILDAKVRRSGKWGLTREEFPLDNFPPYEAGSAYIITGDVIKELLDASEYVPPIHIDDVYVTGILGRITNITHVRQEGFAFANSRIPTACDVVLNRIVTGTKALPWILKKIWTELHSIDYLNKEHCATALTTKGSHK